MIEQELEKNETEPKYIPAVGLSFNAGNSMLKGMGYAIRRFRYSKIDTRQYLETLIEDKDKWLDFYDKHPYFAEVCAGASHHHWWVGGLNEHTSELIGIGLDMLQLYQGDLHKLTPDKIIQAGFLHDFAKIWTYRKLTDEEKTSKKFHEKQQFKYKEGAFNINTPEDSTLLELARYGIVPEEDVWSAVCFAEGGFAADRFAYGGKQTPTSATVNEQNPLVVIIHIGDLYSSQVLGASIWESSKTT